MIITLNGNEQQIPANSTIQSLLLLLGVQLKKLAVEVNGTIIPATQYETTRLNNNDCVELIQFVGGG